MHQLGVILAAFLTPATLAADALRTVPVADGLTQPVSLAAAPRDAGRLFVVEKRGRIKVVDLTTRSVLPTPFLDIVDIVHAPCERGLLDIVFDPAFEASGHVFVSYNHEDTGAMTIARYDVSDDPNVLDPRSEVVIKTIPHRIIGHNGGRLQFGLDGLLYFASGDGSTAALADPMNNAQNPQLLLGKMIRLDVHAPPDYIPLTNPYVGDPSVRDEIWASGLRNPWRFSVDRLTGDIYIGDVGWADREEINFQPAASPGGENYGWRCMEGTACTRLDGCTCQASSLSSPVLELTHGPPDGTCAIIGGFVYRGSAIPELRGRYLYADYCGDFIRSVRVVDDGRGQYIAADAIDHTAELNPAGAITTIVSFGEDAAGELYVVSLAGRVWKIAGPCPPDLNGDGVVAFADLLAMLSTWGPCAIECPHDLDGDETVGFADLLLVLAGWGPCS